MWEVTDLVEQAMAAFNAVQQACSTRGFGGGAGT
jgi:hypothetical protein